MKKSPLFSTLLFLALGVLCILSNLVLADQIPGNALVTVETKSINAGTSGFLRVFCTSDFQMAALIVPLKISDPDLVVDSVSFSQSIVNPVTFLTSMNFSAGNHEFSMLATPNPSYPVGSFSPPGGEFCRIYVTVPLSHPFGLSKIDSVNKTLGPNWYQRIDASDVGGNSILPKYIPGGVLIPSTICGDVDASGSVNMTDAVAYIRYVFLGGPPLIDPSAGDFNCDGSVNISDIVFLLKFLFAGGPAPCSGCR